MVTDSPRFSVNFQNSKITRHCGSRPSYKESGPSWSVTSAGEAILLVEMMRE